ncbi:hypothetical protein C6499_00340 [Candidatus Poribacteria bacterium]|nr:MAG: hypothetical protein C6499_00340 [Candidatus Poribacteria bacterium]
MYLKEIYLENTGPISKCHVELPFADNGIPLPIVIVGPNGSGKSIFLSYIVDALIEFGKRAFRDVVLPDSLESPYFRIIHPRGIRSGELFSLSLLQFKVNDDNLYYCEKSGLLDPTTYTSNLKSLFAKVWNWSTSGNHKEVSTDNEDIWSAYETQEFLSPIGKIIKTQMQEGAYAFFPASRHEDPVWLNPEILKVNMDASVNRRFSKDLGKPLQVKTCANENIGWILDVLFDASVDYDIIRKLQGGAVLSDEEKTNWNNSRPLQQSRYNIERILQAVLQDKQVKLIRRLRNSREQRLAIQLSNGQVIPNLQSLSQGQSQLFHLFTTIIRYGERTDLNRSVRLSEVTGIVIIDEIDTHLHPTLQHSIVPKLVKLFPKVQFIISSHSPLFLLGMEKEFGPDGLDIRKLPDGDRINSEEYSEFRSTFEYYQATERFEAEIKQRFANMTKPVVLTEGKTDVKYIQKALALLGEQELLNFLNIEPVGKEGEDGDNSGGKTGLDNFHKVYAVKSSIFHQPILLLYDSDAKKVPGPVDRLSVKSIPLNDKNTKVKGGIENLFPTEVFQDCFYDEKIIVKNDGGQRKESELNKPKFCEWICKNGSTANFEGLKVVIEILKEFVEAHKTPQDQQPVSEQ